MSKTKGGLQIEMNGSYKLGMNEVVGLKAAITEAFSPIKELLKDKAYWNESLDFEELEYKSRDGFIPYGHNCGGLELSMHVPRCEQYEFGFLEFGECDGCNEDQTACCGMIDDPKDPNYNHGECGYESEGHLDAYLRIIFKFEGVNEDGELEFYINACGGNGDAPYFRVQYLTDLFEASFTSKSVKGVKRAASKHIKALLKALGESK